MAAKKDPVSDIVAMLSHEAPERRVAAAIVLGELKAKGTPVLRGLSAADNSRTT